MFGHLTSFCLLWFQQPFLQLSSPIANYAMWCLFDNWYPLLSKLQNLAPSLSVYDNRISCSLCCLASSQYFTLPHGFRRILADSHGMLEFHPESAGMVGISYSDGFRWILNGIPMDSTGFWMEFQWIPPDSEWNSNGLTTFMDGAISVSHVM